MSRVTKHIFLGSYYETLDEDFMRKNQIKYVLNTASEIPISRNQVITMHIKLNDSPSQCLILDPALRFINEAISRKMNILIHCHLGKSRSAAILIAYLIIEKGMTYKKALSLITRCRPIVDMNEGFQQQLKNLSLRIYKKI